MRVKIVCTTSAPRNHNAAVSITEVVVDPSVRLSTSAPSTIGPARPATDATELVAMTMPNARRCRRSISRT